MYMRAILSVFPKTDRRACKHIHIKTYLDIVFNSFQKSTDLNFCVNTLHG